MAEAIAERTRLAPEALGALLASATEPVVLRGLASHWPMVQAACRSAADAAAYLRRHDAGATVNAMLGAPGIGGRFFYDEAGTGFNFDSTRLRLAEVLDRLERHRDDPQPPAIYVGSTTVDTCLPGFRAGNDLDLGTRAPLVSLWLGNRSRIAAHQDVPDNLACVVAGRRRFTLFPPQQLPNLYVGPLDLTPAGQAISLVDFAAPDLVRFPRFADAMQHARVAELAPGDALFIPSLWWHHVEALEPFNALVNYWWRDVPAWMDAPISALMLAILSVRDLPTEQRAAWEDIFRHYVFEADAETAAHIPAAARGVLAPLDDGTARRLRAQLLKKLNR
jgi:hypothetical protein